MSASDPLEKLTELVRTQRRGLVAAAVAEGATGEDALECVQDALMTFLRVEREGTLPESPREQAAAAYTMVKNAARNLRRRHYRLKAHDLIDDEATGAVAPNAEELLAHAEETIRLRACISSLCSVQRAVVTLRLLEERSGDDVAAALGLSRGYVDVIVTRARQALRVCMRAHDRPDPT